MSFKTFKRIINLKKSKMLIYRKEHNKYKKLIDNFVKIRGENIL